MKRVLALGGAGQNVPPRPGEPPPADGARREDGPRGRLRWRAAFLALLALAAVVGALSVRPFGDSAGYLGFADRRSLFGIANFMDTISNAPWLVIGVVGLLFAWRTKPGAPGPFAEAWERIACAAFFVAVAGVSIGSAYFHLEPTVGRLFWDRLPMTVAFMCLFALVIGDRIGSAAGRLLFLPLVVLGAASAIWWRHTAAAGAPDLRLYALVQYFPMAAIPAMLILFPGRYTQVRALWGALGCYVLAKLFELADRPVFSITGGLVSGHTLKHLSASAAALLLLVWLRRRRIRFSAQFC
jgi:hypothetical protein